MRDLPTIAHCTECGMPCEAAEYHPYAACLMYIAMLVSLFMAGLVASFAATYEEVTE